MSYKTAVNLAKQCKTYIEVESLLKRIEDDDNITDVQYYNVKTIAINAAYKNQ